jgi:hypothetical protein
MADTDKYTFAEKNSVFLSLMGIKENDLPKIIKLLSYLARKSIK